MWPSHDRTGSKIIHLIVLVIVIDILSKLASITTIVEYIVGAVGVEVWVCVFTLMLLSYRYLTCKKLLDFPVLNDMTKQSLVQRVTTVEENVQW